MQRSKSKSLFISLLLSFYPIFGICQDQPAPWTLKGDGYIIFIANSKEQNLKGGFISNDLKDRFKQSFSVVILVNYKSSPVGPYQELLFIPGSFQFDDDKTYASVSKIFVSSMSSVINGRRNWGIPKELAKFRLESSDSGQDTITVFNSNTDIARFTLSSLGPKIPISTFVIPKFFKTLGQELNDQTYIFEIKAHGWAQLASLKTAQSDPDFFPDMAHGKVLLAMKINGFTLDFPIPEIYPKI